LQPRKVRRRTDFPPGHSYAAGVLEQKIGRATLAMTLLSIRCEARKLRAEVAALELMPHERARFLGVLESIEHRVARLHARLAARRRSH
jgi:hypothetical protein